MQQLGKYKIERLIAEGGMARIYLARNLDMHGVERLYALKCLHSQYCLDGDFVRMLVNEARLTSQMTHPNICKVYGLEEVRRQYFIVMEYIDGVDLSKLIGYYKRVGRLMPVACAVYCAMGMCAGLSYAHNMRDNQGEKLQIIHRDINPQNVILSKEGDIKIIDFGVAKASSVSGATQAGMIKGKLHYMSPEQAQGGRLDLRSDIFAVGAVLYEMLCGEMMYSRQLEERELRLRVRTVQYASLRERVSGLDPMLYQIVEKSLARESVQRFDSAEAMLSALQYYFQRHCHGFDRSAFSKLVRESLDSHSMGAGMGVSGYGVFEGARTEVFAKDDLSEFAADVQRMRLGDVSISTGDSSGGLDLGVDKGKQREGTVVLKLGGGLDVGDGHFYVLYLFVVVVVIGLSVYGSVLFNREMHREVLLESFPPGASIWIDGEDSGEVTPHKVSLAGKLMLRKRFYQDYEVDLNQVGNESVLSVSMSPRRCHLEFVLKQDGVMVNIDGENIGIAPVSTVLVMREQYQVKFIKEGYREESRVVRCNEESGRMIPYRGIELTALGE